MPQIIQYLDKSDREKALDIVSVILHGNPPPIIINDQGEKLDGILYIKFTQINLFQEVTDWLTTNNIKWYERGLLNTRLKRRSIYLPVPFDETNPTYQKLAMHFENPDGSMKIPDAAFCYTPLTDAMAYDQQQRNKCWERHNEERRKWYEWRKMIELDVANQLDSIEHDIPPFLRKKR